MIWGALLLIEVLVLYLYDQPQIIFWDTLLFSAFVIVVASCVKWFHWQKKLRQLNLLRDNFSSELLPKSQDQCEQLYQMIARNLEQQLITENEQDRLQKQAMLDDFGIWLHQVKTPVAALDLLIQANGRDPKMRAELFKINEYLQLMLNYLRQNLDKSDLVFEKVSLAHLTRSVLKKYALFFSEKDISLVFKGDDPWVNTDKKWLVFILEQIIFNALKYTEHGTITVTLTENELQLSDTGIGIRAEELPRVFEKGYTGYNGRKDQRASGLGLYLSKQVAEKLGCTIALTSTVGQGTTVTLRFPKKQNFD